MYVENTIGPPELGNAQKIKLAKAFVTHSNAKYVVAKIDENLVVHSLTASPVSDEWTCVDTAKY